MVITHNMMAQNGMRQLNIGEKKLQKSTSRLSSGYRINGAADDAAGLSISEKMRWQVRGLNRASANSQDGISYIQIAEGALNEMHSILDRCKELSVQAANDTNTDMDREAVQQELDELTKEIDRISSTTQYNTLNVFSTNGASPDQASAMADMPVIEVTLSYIDADGNRISVDSTSSTPGTATNYTGDQATIAAYVADQAGKAANQILAAYPALQGASSANIQVGLNLAYIDGPHDTLASAAISMSWGTNISNMTYTMNVDTADYDITNYNDGELAATIAHEMTHLIMYDTLTAGMLNQNAEGYPLWFVEGMAQTASGDNGWMSGLSTTSSDSDIRTYLSKVSSMPYGAGYLGTLYLAQMASGSAIDNVSTSSLRNGVNTILDKLVDGYTLSQVIADVSGGAYQNYTAFQNNVASDSNAIQFTHSFLNARGSNGAGSVIATSLATAETNILSASSSGANYQIDTGHTSYTNVFQSGFTYPIPGVPGGGGGGTGTAGTNLGGDIKLQVGALANQPVALTTFDVSANTLFSGNVMDVSDFAHASASITYVDDAVERVSKVRSYYGAMQNRLEHIIANLDNTAENVQAAESRLRDTDMAEEMVSYSTQNIINQAAQSVLAQSNRVTEGVLQLLNV